MKMKMLKSILLITLLTIVKLSACGDIGWESYFIKEADYDFLDPVLIEQQEENPLYNLATISTYAYKNRVQYFKKIEHKLNVQEWKKYFNNRVSTKELERLFYDEENSPMSIYPSLASKLNNPNFKRYLEFVEEQSTIAQSIEEVDRDPLNVSDKGEKLLRVEKDKFLKLRYLFLTMRIYHYAGEYKATLHIYNEFYPQLKEIDSIVFEWIDALRAGALQHLGKDVESNLLYGEILKNNKTNAYLGYYDFKIKNDEQWNNLLAKAKTADDKALFYFLRALKWEGVPLIEHRQIAKIAPHSIWFERLSYLIMQEFQSANLESKESNKYSKANTQNYLEKKNYFLKTLSTLKKPSFFSLYSKAYLEIRHQEHLTTLNQELKHLKKIANPKQKTFVEMLSYINSIRAIRVTHKGANEALFKEMINLLKKAPASKRKIIFAYTAHYMEKLYPKNSPEALFSHLNSLIQNGYGWWGVEDVIDIVTAKEFEAYIEKKNRSIYEQKLFKNIMHTLHRNDIAKFLAILYTKDGEIEKANHYLEQIPKLNRETKFNPFNVSLSGNNRKVKSKKGYTQRKFVKTMLKIRHSLDKNSSSAMDHFLFATGLYNSSWFGNFPMAGSVSRSVTSFSEAEAEHILKNLDLIEKEYKLALKYAKKKEFKAKIAYQLLKVAYNRVVISQREYGSVYVGFFQDKTLKDSPTFTKAIKSYKEEYASTKFGRNIIRQCASFRYFR